MGQVAGYPKRLTKNVAKSVMEEVKAAKEKLKHGQDYRRTKREEVWKRSERQYEGDHWGIGMLDDTGELIVVNMSFSTVNTIVPYMTGSDPEFIVIPYSGNASVRNAAVQAALLNRIWRSHDVAAQNEMETVSVDFLVYGDGYAKVGYTIEEKRTDQNTFEDVASLWVDRVSPWDVWIDPTSDGIHNARWVAQRLRITRTELEQHQGYANTDEHNVTFGQTDYFDEDAHDNERFRNEVFDGSEFAVLYEFYDLVNMRKLVFADGDRPLQYIEDIGECPIVQMGNYRIPRSPYHMGELEQLWSLQLELNRTRSQMITHRKRNVQKFAYRKDAIDPDALAALKSAEVNEGIPVKGDAPLEDLLRPLQVPNLSGDVYAVSEIMQRDIYEISGVNEYLRGATPEIRRTATEASIIEGASNIKSQFKLRQIEKAIRKIGRLMLGFAKDVYPQTNFDETTLFLTGREAERVAKADGHQLGPQETVAVSPHPDIFQGVYEVEVAQSSTELRNPIMREQKYKGIFQELVSSFPVLAEAGVIPDFKRIMELWFEAAGVDDIDAMFVNPQGPAEAAIPPEAEVAADEAIGGILPGQVPPNLPELQEVLGPDNTGALPPEFAG